MDTSDGVALPSGLGAAAVADNAGALLGGEREPTVSADCRRVARERLDEGRDDGECAHERELVEDRREGGVENVLVDV